MELVPVPERPDLGHRQPVQCSDRHVQKAFPTPKRGGDDGGELYAAASTEDELPLANVTRRGHAALYCGIYDVVSTITPV